MVTLLIKGTSETYDIKPTKIIALGLNYLAHIKESLSVDQTKLEHEIPKEPVLFPKTPNVLIGPGEAIILPKIIFEYGFNPTRTDYEAELAIIIKKKCKHVSESEAMEYIFGFTCMNDVSQRNIQKGDKSGWFRGKSFDTFGPVGPVIVRPADIGNPQNLFIKCRLNGELKQDSNTKFMIFNIPQIIAFISKNFTLEEGDIITTGTPKGVGSIKEGDEVEVEIENIGVLRNSVIRE